MLKRSLSCSECAAKSNVMGNISQRCLLCRRQTDYERRYQHASATIVRVHSHHHLRFAALHHPPQHDFRATIVRVHSHHRLRFAALHHPPQHDFRATVVRVHSHHRLRFAALHHPPRHNFRATRPNLHLLPRECGRKVGRPRTSHSRANA